MKFIIGADLVVTEYNEEYFEKGEAVKYVGEELLDIIKAADFKVYNVETAVTDTNNPIVKCGPNIKTKKASVEGIKSLDPDLILLSNNHVLDYGEEGLKDTIEALKSKGINYMGAGANLKEAMKPFVFKKDGKTVGFINICEHEFTIAKENKWGANPYDPLETFDHIIGLKKECDYVFVIYHGGKEHYQYPSPELQKRCRKMVEKGADLVICQHSHCVGCMEEYMGGKIIYGQGNFIFFKPEYAESPLWHTGLLIEADIKDKLTLNYIPIGTGECGTKLLEGNEGKAVVDGFLARSEEIKIPGLIDKKYSDFCDGMIDEYIDIMNNLINKDGSYNKEYITAVYNYYVCEAHNEVIMKALKNIFECEM